MLWSTIPSCPILLWFMGKTWSENKYGKISESKEAHPFIEYEWEWCQDLYRDYPSRDVTDPDPRTAHFGSSVEVPGSMRPEISGLRTMATIPRAFAAGTAGSGSFSSQVSRQDK